VDDDLIDEGAGALECLRVITPGQGCFEGSHARRIALSDAGMQRVGRPIPCSNLVGELGPLPLKLRQLSKDGLTGTAITNGVHEVGDLPIEGGALSMLGSSQALLLAGETPQLLVECGHKLGHESGLHKLAT
jgi:hypothetical protein